MAIMDLLCIGCVACKIDEVLVIAASPVSSIYIRGGGGGGTIPFFSEICTFILYLS